MTGTKRVVADQCCGAIIDYQDDFLAHVDNLFRFWLQKKIGDTHPLITIFGVIIGLNLFGFIGLIFGPILLSLFLLLIQIYQHEFGNHEPLKDDTPQ